MASLDSLPAELLEWIVELSVPTPDEQTWPERAATLRALCLTSTTISAVARRRFYDTVLVGSAEAARQLLHTLTRADRTSVPPVQLLEAHVEDPVLSDRWPRDGHPNPVLALLEEARAKTVRLAGSNILVIADTDCIQQAQTLVLHHVHLLPALPISTFHNLRRLGMYNIQLSHPEQFLNSATLPSLVTFALALGVVRNTAEGGAASMSYRLVSFRDLDVPMRQLNAVSSIDEVPSAADARYQLLDTGLDEFVAHPAASLPDTLTVLRLAYYPSPDQAFSHRLIPVLASPPFQPRLAELHLHVLNWDGTDLYHDAVLQDLEHLRAWCTGRGIRLFTDFADTSSSPFHRSFWNFLDSVQDRLGLDV
ncbi:hypothetical protein JCM10207_008612 [Rhodosporidiobolus poonsookiae]